MSPRAHLPTGGTVSLVALCFVMVLGIVLASYLTICSRAMNLSNRTYQAGVAQQLAEFGLEEGLRAFNKGDALNWASNPANMTSGAWTFDTTNKRASRTISFNSGKLGQGVTAAVKIRLDNYDAASLGLTYSASASYKVNDLVNSGGIWYRCVQSHTNQAPAGTGGYPNLAYWSPEPTPWSWTSNTAYAANSDVVCNGGTWYRCTTSHTSGTTFTVGSNWASMPAPVMAIYTNTSYTAGTFAFRVGGSQWLRCNTTHTVSATWDPTEAGKWDAADSASPSAGAPAISWAYRSGATYNFNDLVFFSATTTVAGAWYRCKVATSTNSPSTPADWDPAITSGWNWSSGLKYNQGDVVYYNSGSAWYRCIQAHTSSATYAPGSAGGALFWADSPLYSTAWDSGRGYSANDTVSYNGVWYRCLIANNNSNPSTNATNWASAANSSNYWSAATAYTAGTSYASYGGVWYKCTASTTGQSPNNTSYWTPTWTNAMGVVTGGPVIYAEATVTIAGNPPIRTQLRATIKPAPLFPNALAASTTVQVSGGGTIDSYDSITDPTAATRTYTAVVAGGATGSTAVSLTSTTVKGYLSAPSAATTPFAPLVSSGGALRNSDGSVTSSASGNLNMDLTRVSRSPSIPQFDTIPGGSGGLVTTGSSLPKSAALLTTGSALNLNLGTPGATTPTRYLCPSLTIDGTNITSIKINGPVILYVQGNFVMGGVADNPALKITITSTGSLELHTGGSLLINQTSGGIDNLTKDPKKAVLISDNAGASSVGYSDGSVGFYGVIYAPYTTSSGGFAVSNSALNIYGAVSAKKIVYSSDANVHYDTSLRYAVIPGVDQPYSVTEWRILPQTEQATMP